MAGASRTLPPPPGAGIGLKSAHFADILDAAARGAGPSWVEVHPQNYMMDGGPMHHWLTAVHERLPLSFHSVGLSLGNPDGVDRDELERLARLADRYAPALISDHLSWSSLDGEQIPDLLPLPMTAASLAHFAVQVDQVQDRLGRPILIENPSRMIGFAHDSYDEPDFLVELAGRTGCGLLLDLNNVLVQRTNLGIDPIDYVDRISSHLVGEIHVAGHSVEDHGGERLAIDDHGSPVGKECWELLAHVTARWGPRPVLVEWDNDVPAFAELAAEAGRADLILGEALANAA
ncbi:DUF692 domain-containing protein [Sphingomonas xanthus]|uniref:DUF692 domain-containing protein n=1 Tax=Sphingomonas xanthus TaxID=2594473 RepID=A0A516ISS3_9SPHN|nr:DUF692 domain-containing protein [Sphingomonas xanthus]QDP19941.1 DUF692 domain-containing protein [Sphingomonas xanthus]